MTENKITKILAPLLENLGHECVYNSFNLVAPEIDMGNEFCTNIAYDESELVGGWQHFDQLMQKKTMLLTYFVRPAILDQVKEMALKAVNELVKLDVTDHWQARLLTKDTKPFIMQSIFLTNNNYPQLLVPGLTLGGMNFDVQYNMPMPNYFNRVRNYNYVWQKDNYWHYYQKEIINLDPKVDPSTLKPAMDRFYEQGLATLHYQAKNEHYSRYGSYDVEPIMYLSLAKLIQSQTQLKYDLKQMKADQNFTPIINYLTKQLNLKD